MAASPHPSLFTARLLGWLSRPKEARPVHSVALVTALVLAIGWLDYISGPRLSLSLLYLVPIALCVAQIGWRSGIATAAISIVIRVAGDLAYGPYAHPRSAFSNRVVELAVYIIFVWGLHALVSLHRKLEQRVADRTRALEESVRARQQLERELLDIASRERNAIGRELHDDLCQQLVGTTFATKVLAERLQQSDPPAAQSANAIVAYVEEAIATTRRLARGLLLASVPPAELPNELADLANKSASADAVCCFRQEGTPAIDSPAIAAQLLRIAQEAVRNALRHANPRNVEIVLGGNDGATFLMVEDNGQGLKQTSTAGLGLRIMEHRATLIGGTLSVVPAPGEGTRIICHLPKSSTTAPSS